jgi:hypothetical protein
MLSIGKLSPGRADYYLDTVAHGAEEYYLGSGEAPAVGVGAAPNGSASPAGRGTSSVMSSPNTTAARTFSPTSGQRCRASTAFNAEVGHVICAGSTSPPPGQRCARRTSRRPLAVPRPRRAASVAARRRQRAAGDGLSPRVPAAPPFRSAAPHPRRHRQPRVVQGRRPVDHPRRPPALRVVPHRRLRLRGPPARRAHEPSRRDLGAGPQRHRRRRRHRNG